MNWESLLEDIVKKRVTLNMVYKSDLVYIAKKMNIPYSNKTKRQLYLDIVNKYLDSRLEKIDNVIIKYMKIIKQWITDLSTRSSKIGLKQYDVPIDYIVGCVMILIKDFILYLILEGGLRTKEINNLFKNLKRENQEFILPINVKKMYQPIAAAAYKLISEAYIHIDWHETYYDDLVYYSSGTVTKKQLVGLVRLLAKRNDYIFCGGITGDDDEIMYGPSSSNY